MAWFRITRKRVVEQYVYVKARTPAEATERADNMDWEAETADELVRAYKDGAPKRLDGLPRWLWEELGYPDDERIAS